MPVVVKRFVRDTRLWSADSKYQDWLTEGWEEDLLILRGFGMAPIKRGGERIPYSYESFGVMGGRDEPEPR